MSIEIGTERTTRSIGRDLARVAEVHLAADVTKNGQRCAVVLPCGPADRLPCRAELDALVGHLIQRMLPAFKTDAPVVETDLLGRALAEFLDHLGSDILAVAQAALTESNLHDTAGQVRELREAVQSGRTAPMVAALAEVSRIQADRQYELRALRDMADAVRLMRGTP